MTTWHVDAATRLQAELGDDPLAPWCHGLWVSAREHYAEVPLPEGLRAEVRVLGGEPRRLACAEGPGRPLVIVPGLYAGLQEQLFVSIATEALRLDRTVLLLEDRLARDTVALAGPPAHLLERLGAAVHELLVELGGQADVLALSAGLVAAWQGAGPAPPWRHLVGFSGLRDPAVPVDSLDDLPAARVLRVPAGGHLGFGVLRGPSVYLTPFGSDDA